MTQQDALNSDHPAEPPDSDHHQGESTPPPDNNSTPKRGRGSEPLWNNPITMAGAFLAIIGLLGLVTFGLFSLVAPSSNPYVDIVGFMIIPGILVLGLIVMPLGIVLRVRKLRRRDPAHQYTLRLSRIDLRDAAQLRAVKVVVGGTFILLPVVGVTSYHGYHFTDSVDFCSKACHTVMEPEATAYARSDHARVTCAECHIGTGASWFVKSKLSGTRQVLAMMRESYSRPIPPAIHELRPARETCETCHWPEKFFGAQLVERARFASDESSTRRDVAMLLKTGGGSRTGGNVEGIHMHIALEGRIEYVALDNELQEIPWVKMTDFDGNVTVYRSDGRPSTAPKPEGRARRMDCMDCHNRPSHRFPAPSEAVDSALADGEIEASLPFIKREAVAALVRSYPDTESATSGIETALRGFYKAGYPGVFETRLASIDRAVEVVQEIHRTTVFPYMKVDWRTYPDNIGHMYSPGCFRCHEGRHVDGQGRAISHACDGCHTFLNTVEGESGTSMLQEGAFIHSFALEGRHAALRCDRCHSGGNAPPTTCAGCHTKQADFRLGKLAGVDTPDLPAEPMAESVDCTDCHDVSQPVSLEAVNETCVDCHDEEYEPTLPGWREEIDRLLQEAGSTADAGDKRVLSELRQAGPLHNFEASRMILQRMAGSRYTD